MIMGSTDELGTTYLRALGEVLRAQRNETRRSRAGLVAASLAAKGVSIQTYASWETATRTMPVSRLPLVAGALGTTPHALLADVDRVVLADTTVDVMVDMAKLAAVEAPTLAAVARWAHAALIGGRDVMRLPTDEIRRLALLIGVPSEDLAVAFAGAAVGTAA